MTKEDMNNKVKLLSPIQKRDNLSILRSLLSTADNLTQTVDDIEESINDIDIWVYLIDGKIQYVVTAVILGNAYFIQKGAGSGKHYPWPAFFKEIREYARSRDCSEILFSGSLDWEKKLEHLGFSIKEYTYSVEIK